MSAPVIYNGVTYYQQDIRALEEKADPCYWCVAYRNMKLCDAICSYCEENFVFIRNISRPH